MLSYKKINLLDLRLCEDFTIKNKEELLEIKSPIIRYVIKDLSLQLNINKHSESHNLFINICGYIDRLFKIKEINCSFINNENDVLLTISDISKFYDENNKSITIKNLKKEGKIICSFICNRGHFVLKNLLLVK